MGVKFGTSSFARLLGGIACLADQAIDFLDLDTIGISICVQLFHCCCTIVGDQMFVEFFDIQLDSLFVIGAYGSGVGRGKSHGRFSSVLEQFFRAKFDKDCSMIAVGDPIEG